MALNFCASVILLSLFPTSLELARAFLMALPIVVKAPAQRRLVGSGRSLA